MTIRIEYGKTACADCGEPIYPCDCTGYNGRIIRHEYDGEYDRTYPQCHTCYRRDFKTLMDGLHKCSAGDLAC